MTDKALGREYMKVKDFLQRPDQWCQHVLARNVQGEEVSCESSEAVQFCLLGAIRCCYIGVFSGGRHNIEERDYATYKMTRAVNNVPLSEWNDAAHRTFADVRQLLEEVDV